MYFILITGTAQGDGNRKKEEKEKKDKQQKGEDV